jgi:hypothetical protein
MLAETNLPQQHQGAPASRRQDRANTVWNPSYPLAGISRSRTSERTASISQMSAARMASNRRAAKGARKSTMVVRTPAHSFRNSRK